MKITRTKLIRYLAATVCAIVLAGCNQQQDEDQNRRLAALESQIHRLDTLSSNEVEAIKYLNDQISPLQQSIWQLQRSTGGSYTEVDLASTGGYVPVRGRFGVFLVSVKNVEPYLDGYRVTFEVGNPQYATFSNLKIKTVWGSKFEYSKATNDVNYVENYNASLKRKEFSQADKLLPGSWNKVSIVLSPAKSDELAAFSISFDAETVSLSTPRD